MDKSYVVFVLSLLAGVLVVAVLSGCSDQNAGIAPSDQMKENYAGGIKDISKIAPANLTNGVISYTNLKQIREDTGMQNAYAMLVEGLRVFNLTFSVNAEDIDSYVRGIGWGAITGSFDIEGVRNALNNLEFSQGEYKGVEFWTPQSNDNGAIAVMENMLIFGEKDVVMGIIDNMKGAKSSLYDYSESVRTVVDDLPDGFIMRLVPSAGLYYEGAEAIGASVVKDVDGTLKLIGVFKFNSSTYAEKVGPEIETNFQKSPYYSDVSLVQSGEIVKVVAELDAGNATEFVVRMGY
ncbi:hypothetical protein [Geoglobus acetivorans]|uniref:Lipoprotein n=1 Tax=Geoglobus acetivorans TaxID=565033 RepID=A0ABZ3H1I6_GEOAI|nr:hypothetical protein [Geoglobus acetivorans]